MSYIKSKIEKWVNKIPISYFIKIQKEIEINRLLTELENAEYEEVKLGSICEYIKKGIRNNTYGTLYPYYKNSLYNQYTNIIHYSDTYLFDGPHILMNGIGTKEIIGNSIIVDNKFFANHNLYVIKNKENINITYIYNKLQSLSTEIKDSVVGIAISKNNLSKLKIKIPKNRLLMKNYDKINILQKEIKLFEIEYKKIYLELENFSMVLF